MTFLDRVNKCSCDLQKQTLNFRVDKKPLQILEGFLYEKRIEFEKYEMLLWLFLQVKCQIIQGLGDEFTDENYEI